ncbi:formyltransferase family protein [Bradyrhizobium guangxiense]|uniref:formyltransferase family protein n=1 Tax=Bradyrhizobium guangxiense TaxID=1325115 RepID=UPI0010087036|nr:formyltransferase family protein [Bradyrhizobium guangxiense]
MSEVAPVYCVATVRPWNVLQFERTIRHLPGQWHLIAGQPDLTLEKLQAIGPKAIFFPHWNWKVPDQIVSAFECVAFHAAPLPYGKGGSPIQNMIERGFEQTKLTAFRMNAGFDDGDIYLQRDLSLAGSAHDIFIRMAELTASMIGDMVREWPTPIPQVGEAMTFKRRKPEQSRLDGSKTLARLYDHIRMLDAPEYPKSFIEIENTRIEFSNAELEDGALRATATFRKIEP